MKISPKRTDISLKDIFHGTKSFGNRNGTISGEARVGFTDFMLRPRQHRNYFAQPALVNIGLSTRQKFQTINIAVITS
ncbi:MAG: hypothetical protein QM642_08530, partial [Edaphocola sp.]